MKPASVQASLEAILRAHRIAMTQPQGPVYVALDVIDNSTGEVSRLDSGGLFIFIGADAETAWLPAEVALDAKGFVLTGQDGFSNDQARGFQPTPQEFQFGLCAPGGNSPICSIDPNTAPKVMDDAAKRDAEEHDTLRGREIVALVREELNSLRREFKLGQQMAAWQQGGMPLPPAIAPLRDALNDAPIPVALRALLIDSIKDHTTMADAMGALSRQLSHSVEQEQAHTPVSGIHALAGPSGAGKSMMIARLAQHAATQHGCEKIMVISFQDQRAGAWNQTQLLCAQSGVDSFRATNAATLKLLLEEHAGRQLILIDTPGVQMNERLAEIRAMNLNVQCHAVIPADASAANIRRVFDNTDNVWASLMLSKLDESNQPWALLQFLTDKTLSVSVASRGDRIVDLVQDVSLAGLVQCALDNLPLPESEEQAQLNAREAAVNELAASKLSQIAAQFKTETTGLTHE